MTPMPTPSPSSLVNAVEDRLRNEGIEVGTFSPNPTSDRSFLIIGTTKPININVNVLDVNSRNVFSRNYSLRSGSNSIEVELPSASTGFYQVMIDFDGKIVARRLMSL
jgi:hypothetical protein